MRDGRPHNHWHPAPDAPPAPGRRRPPGIRIGHIYVLLLIVLGLVVLGMAAPLISLEAILAHFGFR